MEGYDTVCQFMGNFYVNLWVIKVHKSLIFLCVLCQLMV